MGDTGITDTDKFLATLTEDERRILRMMSIIQTRFHMTMPEILAGVMKQHDEHVLNGVEKIIDKRERKALLFWRRVLDALWSGASQAHALLQKLFKE